MAGYIQVLDNMQKSFWLLISVFLLSCGKEGEVPELGLDYYPMELGLYRIYEVEETTYSNKIATTENYQLRESFIEEIAEGNESVYTLRIERRSTSDDIWQSISNIYLRQTRHMLEYRENNISIVSMSYPVKVGRSWNGNQLNGDVEAIYHYDEADLSDLETEVIKVVISDLPPNIVELDQRYEVYGKGIGLVERNFSTIEYCQTNCNGEFDLPENGRILVQQLVAYGFE